MTTLERFLKYISIPTTSDSRNMINPSTDAQRNLATHLVSELKALGVHDVYYDNEHCYIYAVLEGDQSLPKIGFIAHMDTSEDAKGENIKPRFIYNYDGKDINYDNGLCMKVHDNPDLLNHVGKTVITSDGSTLLGADDKAGIAEIMGMLEHFTQTGCYFGDICVCFTPDEEIGLGVLNFKFDKFPVDFAYTVDGEHLGEISYENFNAASAEIEIIGTPTHCGYAKGKMINSLLIANKINQLLPDEIPSNTEEYEGFFHLDKMEGDISKTTMKYLIRDFDTDNFEKRKRILKAIVQKLNESYNDCISLKITNSYYNMKTYMQNDMHLVETFKKAAESLGIKTIVSPIRGGTDGAELTYLGIPCPNIGSGGHNFHSVFEYIAVEDMEQIKNLLIALVNEYSKIDRLELKRIKDE